MKSRRRWGGAIDFASLTLRQARRVVILVFGTTIVLLGLALIVLPGPGLVVIFLGLGLLAIEFAWAKRLLAHARGMARGVGDRILGRSSSTPRTKRAPDDPPSVQPHADSTGDASDGD